MRFAPREFTGKVAEGRPPFFHAQLRAVSSYNRDFRNESLKELPVLEQVTAAAVADNYERIWVEAKGILAEREA